MAVVPSIHFGLTYPLPTDNHQEFWRCCCFSWHTDNFRCPWACAWLGQLWKHSSWTRKSPTLWALKAGLPFLFILPYCHCFLLPRGAEHTWMIFAVWGVQNNYGSIFSVVLGADRFHLLKQKAGCWPLLGTELVLPVPLPLVCCTAGIVVLEKGEKQQRK